MCGNILIRLGAIKLLGSRTPQTEELLAKPFRA